MSVFQEHPALAVVIIVLGLLAIASWAMALIACDHGLKTRQMVRKLDDVFSAHLRFQHGIKPGPALPSDCAGCPTAAGGRRCQVCLVDETAPHLKPTDGSNVH